MRLIASGLGLQPVRAVLNARIKMTKFFTIFRLLYLKS
jgi:hypothetical protein